MTPALVALGTLIAIVLLVGYVIYLAITERGNEATAKSRAEQAEGALDATGKFQKARVAERALPRADHEWLHDKPNLPDPSGAVPGTERPGAGPAQGNGSSKQPTH